MDATTDAAPLPTAPTGCDTVYFAGAPTGTCAVFAESWTCPDTAQFNGLVVASDGGFALAGQLGGFAWILHTDPLGKTSWQKVFTDLGSAVALVVLPGGGYVLAGNGPAPCADESTCDATEGWLLRTDAQGVEVWKKTWKVGPAAPDFPAPLRLAALPDGGVALVGAWAFDSYQHPILHFDPAGTLLWMKPFAMLDEDLSSGGSFGDYVLGLGALPDGGVALGLHSHVGPGTYAQTILRTDATGKPLWSHEVMGGIAVRPDGGIIAAGGHAKGAFVQRLDPAGSLLWNACVLLPVPDAIGADGTADAAVLSDGDVEVHGHVNEAIGGKWDTVYARLAPDGRTRWQRQGGSSLVVAVADGGMAMTHGKDLIRTDWWGNHTCEEAVPCAGTATSACDDGDPCTSDLCQGLAGCVHAPLEDGLSCGGKPGKYGNSELACMAGKCLPTP